MEKDHLEILLEDIRGRFDLVLEGQDTLRKEIRDTRESLCEKIELVDFKVGVLNQKIDGVQDTMNRKLDSVQETLIQKLDDVEARLTKKIDAVAADLTAHRADTEVHRKVYEVRDEE
jgi:hypothetical protein